MHLALLTTFTASRKEPLVEMLERVHAAIIAADLGEPHVQFILADSPIAGGVSSVERVLKRFPSIAKFAHDLAPAPGRPAIRVITNRPASGAAGEPVEFATLLEIARGVPRSFPFHKVGMHFSVPAFSAATVLPPLLGDHAPGISVNDSWWVNGRQRSLTALTIVDADAAAKKLPQLPATVAAVLAACGKVKKTVQVPLVAGPAPQRPSLDTAAPDTAQAIRAVVHEYRTKMSEVVGRASLPHDLPPNREAMASAPPGTTAGPKKPALVSALTPMGYECRGGSGTFTLRRRTPANLTVELLLDVGTWSNLVIAIFRVQGMVSGIGFKASLTLPVAPRAIVGSQYPMGGPERWQQIVENLAALTAELDRSFVPAIEAVSGPAPDWYQPEEN